MTRTRAPGLVGDGVNDAPAMAAAHLGVAMGRHGSDLALETADAVIVRDELAILPKVMHLSARAHRLVKANLTVAAMVIGVLIAWDIIWILPPPLGVAGHEGSTMVVGLNGLRLLRRYGHRPCGQPGCRAVRDPWSAVLRAGVRACHRDEERR